MPNISLLKTCRGRLECAGKVSYTKCGVELDFCKRQFGFANNFERSHTMVENKTQFNEDSSAVQAHLTIMQSIIQMIKASKI